MNTPFSIALEFHLFSALLTSWQLDLRACVAPIHQLGKCFSHQLSSALARLRFDLSKTGLRVCIVPFFHLIVHLLRFFHKSRLTAGARLWSAHFLYSSYHSLTPFALSLLHFCALPVAPAINQNNIDKKTAKPMFDVKRVGSEKPNANNSVTLPLNTSAIIKDIPAIRADSTPPIRGRFHFANLLGVGDSVMGYSFPYFRQG